MADLVVASRPGFLAGFAAPFAAARQLLSLPRAWPLLLVPAVVFVLLEGAIVGLSWHWIEPWVSAKLTADAGLRRFGAFAVTVVLVALSGALGWLLSAFLAPVLSAPALERVVTLTEQELGAPERAPLGFVAEFWCGLRSLLLSGVVTLPLVVGLTLLELVVPPLAVVVTPFKVLLGALGVAWGLFDYPLTLRGMGARARFAFMTRHFSVVLGFGVAFTLVFWLPCFGTLMLPVAVAAATRLYWQLARANAAPP